MGCCWPLFRVDCWSVFVRFFFSDSSKNIGRFLVTNWEILSPYTPCPSHTQKTCRFELPRKFGRVKYASWFFFFIILVENPCRVRAANFKVWVILLDSLVRLAKEPIFPFCPPRSMSNFANFGISPRAALFILSRSDFPNPTLLLIIPLSLWWTDLASPLFPLKPSSTSEVTLRLLILLFFLAQLLLPWPAWLPDPEKLFMPLPRSIKFPVEAFFFIRLGIPLSFAVCIGVFWCLAFYMLECLASEFWFFTFNSFKIWLLLIEFLGLPGVLEL